MGIEIEKKFLVKNSEWRKNSDGILFRQGYLSTVKERTVRVRTINDKGFLTIKGINIGATRAEYEYEISVSDANEMLDSLCEKPIIEKKRHKIEFRNLIWEVDEFFGENKGLIIAEVELGSEDQEIHFPDWIGKEVTGDARYFNSNLIKNPFKNW